MTDARFDDEKQAADLSARMFWSPSPARSAIGILLLSIIIAIPLFYRGDEPLAGQRDLLAGILLAFAATMATAALTQAYASRKGVMYPRRAFLLALVGLAAMLPGAIAGAFLPPPWSMIAWVGITSPVWVRHVVLTGTSRPSHRANLPCSLLHTAMMASFAIPLRGGGVADIAVLVASSAAFLLGAYIFLQTVSGPMRRVYGIAPYDLLVDGLEHFTTGGGLQAEGFFHGISSRARVWYGHLRIRQADGDDIDVFSTALHPGPFGIFGGSDLPAKLRRTTGWRRLMAFHGPSGHDTDPARTEDVERVAAELVRGSRDIALVATATPPSSVRRGDVTVTGQMLGDILLVACSRAPAPSDDVDYPTGMMALDAAKRASGAGAGLFVDAHNSLERGTGSILFGDEGSFDAVGAASALEPGEPGPFRAGYGEASSVAFKGDLAGAGVQALVVEVGGRTNAYVLLDGNNLLRGHRDRLVEAVSDIVGSAEMFTTDNHAVNATIGGYRPIGIETPLPELETAVRRSVEMALDDLKDAEAGGREGYVDDLPVLGYGTTSKLTAMVNATAGTVRWAATGSLALAAAISLLVVALA